jgi:hypothetical protein
VTVAGMQSAAARAMTQKFTAANRVNLLASAAAWIIMLIISSALMEMW